MLNKTISLVVLFAFLSSQSFAICEQERSEFEDWNSKCEKLSAASQVSGVVGGFFAIATFGASMAPCAAAIAAAGLVASTKSRFSGYSFGSEYLL